MLSADTCILLLVSQPPQPQQTKKKQLSAMMLKQKVDYVRKALRGPNGRPHIQPQARAPSPPTTRQSPICISGNRQQAVSRPPLPQLRVPAPVPCPGPQPRAPAPGPSSPGLGPQDPGPGPDPSISQSQMTSFQHSRLPQGPEDFAGACCKLMVKYQFTTHPSKL